MKTIPIWRLEMAYADIKAGMSVERAAAKNEIPLARAKQLAKIIAGKQ